MKLKKWMLYAIAGTLVIIAGGTALLISGRKGGPARAQSYEFTTIGRGSIESIASSSGTLSVVSSVGVLAQMSGRLEKVNVDFNDRVKKGQVLATINTDLLKLQAKGAQAAVDKAQANYDLQLLALQNAQRLSEKELLSDYDLKTSQSTVKVYNAELSSAKASLEEIQTEINQYSIITSPINGIVLQRDIDAGQSVVGGASSSSTSLFTIAGDLSKMQIMAQVDELDIGSIKFGQEVRFSVEANPGQAYTGSVKEIRLIPDTSASVVYYNVIIAADNESGKLLPGMTASVSFIMKKVSDVLVVPSAALRFTPASLSAAQIRKALYLAGLGSLSESQAASASARYDEEQKSQAAASKTGARKSTGLSSLLGGAAGRPQPRPPKAAAVSGAAVAAVAAVAKKALWFLDGSGKLAVTMVEAGATDGLNTEVSGPADLEGKSVIVKIKVL